MQFYRKPLALPFALLLLTTFESCQPKPDSIPSWPPITREKKPWTRWWWHGSSLTKEGLTAEMEAYQKAGLGGLDEGNVIDHFSAGALQRYLQKFDNAFEGKDIQSLRSFFNDSYEVDDARGTADWTPALFDEFKKQRGYDLQEHLPAKGKHK